MTQPTTFYCTNCFSPKCAFLDRIELHKDPTTQAVHACCKQCLEDPNQLNIHRDERVITACPICLENLAQVGKPYIQAQLVQRAVRAAALPRVTMQKPRAVPQKWERDPAFPLPPSTSSLSETRVGFLRTWSLTLLDKKADETKKRQAWIDMRAMISEKSQDPKQVLSALIKLIPGIDDELNLDIVSNLTTLRQMISKQQPTWMIPQESSDEQPA
jgi:hypothetical protein